MTFSPRLLIALVAGAAPGCLHVSEVVSAPPPAPAAPATEGGFASLRPGESVVARAPDPVALKAPKTPPPPPAADPIAPAPPEEVQVAVKVGDPAPFPLLGMPPVPDPPLLAAVRAYVENRPDEAIRHLEKLDRPNQEFALAVLPVLARGAAMNLAAPDPQEAAHLADQLAAAAARFEAKSPIRVEKVVFCKSLDRFGQYEPWPEARPYRPGDLAQLYVEVRNLVSTPAKDGHRVRVDVSLRVRDSSGKTVEQIDPTDVHRRVPVANWPHNDVFRSPPRDYWQPYRIVVPAAPGVYTITVEVREPGTGRTARSQPAEFRISSP